MSRKFRGPCRAHLCPNLCDPGALFCSKHTKEKTTERFKEHKARVAADPIRSEHSRFYNSKVWRRLRDYIRLHEPLCRLCKAPAEMVDHITPLHEGGAPLDASNLQPLCNPCHARKRGQEGAKAAVKRRG